MNDQTVTPSVEDREPRFFRGLFLAFAICGTLYGALAFAGCATDPATGDVTVHVPAAAVAAATNAAARVVIAIREARDSATLPDEPAADPNPDAGEADGRDTATTPEAPAGGSDPASHSAAAEPVLDFRYGGFKGGSAKEDSRCRISKLKVGSGSLSLHWDTAIPSDWAREKSEKGALVVVAAFYWADNRWIGGKFDWIDETRSSRSLENIHGGYGGWDGAAWAAASRHAVCVVSADGRWRSNLLEAE